MYIIKKRVYEAIYKSYSSIHLRIKKSNSILYYELAGILEIDKSAFSLSLKKQNCKKKNSITKQLTQAIIKLN